jgi:hypothetical protein
MLHAGATLLAGLAGLLLVAAGCTVGDRQPGPAPARLATSPTSADPIGVLRRPLRLLILEPRAPCPVVRPSRSTPAFAEVLEYGPVYPTDSAVSWRDGRVEDGWYYAKVLWLASPAYPGPFLVRGRQLDGPRRPRFGEGPQPATERLLPAGGTAHSQDSNCFNWPSTAVCEAGLLRLPGRQCEPPPRSSSSGLTPPRPLLPCMSLTLAAHCRRALISSVPRQSSAAAEGCLLGHRDTGVPVRAGPHATATTGAGLPLWRRPGRSQLGSSASARAAGATSGRRGG